VEAQPLLRQELNERHERLTGDTLENQEWFVRWLDQLDVHRQPVYERFCRHCFGRLETVDADGVRRECADCGGTGFEIGPTYCACGEVLPHPPRNECPTPPDAP